jgi:hypothetical protein
MFSTGFDGATFVGHPFENGIATVIDTPAQPLLVATAAHVISEIGPSLVPYIRIWQRLVNMRPC